MVGRAGQQAVECGAHGLRARAIVWGKAHGGGAAIGVRRAVLELRRRGLPVGVHQAAERRCRARDDGRHVREDNGCHLVHQRERHAVVVGKGDEARGDQAIRARAGGKDRAGPVGRIFEDGIVGPGACRVEIARAVKGEAGGAIDDPGARQQVRNRGKDPEIRPRRGELADRPGISEGGKEIARAVKGEAIGDLRRAGEYPEIHPCGGEPPDDGAIVGLIGVARHIEVPRTVKGERRGGVQPGGKFPKIHPGGGELHDVIERHTGVGHIEIARAVQCNAHRRSRRHWPSHTAIGQIRDLHSTGCVSLDPAHIGFHHLKSPRTVKGETPRYGKLPYVSDRVERGIRRDVPPAVHFHHVFKLKSRCEEDVRPAAGGPEGCEKEPEGGDEMERFAAGTRAQSCVAAESLHGRIGWQVDLLMKRRSLFVEGASSFTNFKTTQKLPE